MHSYYINRSTALGRKYARNAHNVSSFRMQARNKSSAAFAIPFKTNAAAVNVQVQKFMQQSAKNLRMKPVYVPYYVYQMGVDVAFDVRASFYDPVTGKNTEFKGKDVTTHMKLDDKNQEMFFYAGTEYTREDMNEVVTKMRVSELERTWDGLSDGCAHSYEEILDDNIHFYMEMGGKTSPDLPSPMTDAMFPMADHGGVQPYTIKPSVGADNIKKNILPGVADMIAQQYMKSNPDVELMNGEETKNLADEAPFEFKVENIRFGVKDEGLHPTGGLTYMPMWVCDYNYGGRPFQAFVNGSSWYHLEWVVGSVHMIPQNCLYAGGTATFATVCLANSYSITAIGDASVFGLTAVGMFGGYLAGALFEWKEKWDKLETDKMLQVHMAHDSSKDGKWVSELDKVRANQGKVESSELIRESVSEEASLQRLKTATDYQLLGMIKSESYGRGDKNLAFRRQIMAWHPDHHKPHSKAGEIMKAIRRAYTRLLPTDSTKDRSQKATMMKIYKQNTTEVKKPAGGAETA